MSSAFTSRQEEWTRLDRDTFYRAADEAFDRLITLRDTDPTSWRAEQRAEALEDLAAMFADVFDDIRGGYVHLVTEDELHTEVKDAA